MKNKSFNAIRVVFSLARCTSLVLFFSLAISSCTKDTSESSLLSKGSGGSYYNLDGYDLPLSYHEVEYHVVNESGDGDDVKIGLQLLHIARTFDVFFATNEFNHLLSQLTDWNMNSAVSIVDFLNSVNYGNLDNDRKQIISNVFEVLGSVDMTYMPQNLQEGEDIQTYIPAIHFFNINNESLDLTKNPIFSAGSQVNINLDGMYDYDDYIVAWIWDEESNEKIEFLLNENVAINIDRPIFLIDNANLDFLGTEKAANETTEITEHGNYIDEYYGATHDMMEMKISTYEFQINERYEGTGKSEFAINAYHLVPVFSSVSPFIYLRSDVHKTLLNATASDAVIKLVNPSQVGSPNSVWFNFCSQKTTPFGYNYIFWNTYERDWYATFKPLGNINTSILSSTLYLQGRMKYENEWYAFNPSFAFTELDLSEIYYNWAKNYSNSKGNLRFWKVY